MLSIKWRKTVRRSLVFVLLFSLIVPFNLYTADAAQIVTESRQMVRISAGGFHSLALKADGTVVVWGDNSLGQTTVPEGLSDVASIAAGYNHSLALKADGTVVAWGENNHGQTTVPAGLSDVASVAAGYGHSLALKSDGTIIAWGLNDYGQTSIPAGLSNVVAIAGGGYHSLALKSDGTVVAWGYNDFSQSSVPIGLTGVVSIAAGEAHSLAFKSDGTVVGWGLNGNGQTSVPVGLTGVTSIAGGGLHSLALISNGTLVGWGLNGNGQTSIPAGLTGVMSIAGGEKHSLVLKVDGTILAFGDNSKGQTSVPTGLDLPVKGNRIVAGGSFSLAIKADSTVVGWGRNASGERELPVGLSGVVSIAAGDYHTLVLKSDGTVVGWGNNDYNQTIMPAGITKVVSIAAGALHSLVLKSDGTVIGWGHDLYGQSSVPAGLSDVVSIAAGYFHSMALKSNGTVVTWGSTIYGDTTVPAGLTDVVSIAAGEFHSLALKVDGTIVGWGNNVYGQSSVPAGLSDVVAIAAGANHSLALKSDGTLVAWGLNNYNQRSVPDGLNDVVSIAGGNYHSLALQADGTVIAWGRNSDGETTVPGNTNLSSLMLQEGGFTQSFDPTVTAYTYYYDGQSLPSIHVTPTLEDTTYSQLYVNNELVTSGSTKAINIAGVISDMDVLVRVEPYLQLSKTYTITLSIDSTAPVVQFSTNGGAAASTSAASLVTVSDTQSGIDSASLKYAWTQSTTVPSSGWTDFSDGDTLSQASGTGNWYLHIRATDKVGNVVDKVSNPFVLDNTAPTAVVSSSSGSTVNASFPVTISFSEPIHGFTENDMVIENGTVSDLVAVTSSTYKATVSPTTSGQAVKITVAAGTVTDAAGNLNTISNTLLLQYDTTKPVVTFGNFTDKQRFIVQPTEVTVSVSEAVYWIAGGAQLHGGDALQLISMQKDGEVFSAYTTSYDELSHTFTLSFNDLLKDGDYELHVAGNVVRNANHNELDAASASFTVDVPVITGISAHPASVESSGGSIIATIAGSNLIGQTIQIYVDGVETAAANVGSETSAEATVTLPSNTTQAVKTHLLTIYLNGVEVAGQSAAVSVLYKVSSSTESSNGSSNADLAALKVIVAGKELILSSAFTPGIKEYNVETDVDQVELQLTSSDSKAIVKLNGNRISETTNVQLALGANVLRIIVQAQNGASRTYTVSINRIANKDTGSTDFACLFTDVENHWAKSDICEAASLGIVEGVSVHSFVSDHYVTRTEFAAMLMRTLQINISNDKKDLPFSDKDSIPEWARLMIPTAVDEGILEGYSDGKLRPMQSVNRSEMAAMISRSMKWNAGSTESPFFSDDASIPAWAKADIEAVSEHGILVGRSGNQFVPYGLTTRAEAAVALVRLWKVLH
ncbi:S-layer homology domain-containing protein [Paenibacillus sp. FSL H8-0548]|uniref:S-layer homology domain-containing protein n=1 Tax=Paenibacillus sp. FSL H8-0548 TaxID=1920422 RepID=UPI001C4D7403|nr:S-layer homology domain-containing protein [Paenibacillus sp. FSL H8-0548]